MMRNTINFPRILLAMAISMLHPGLIKDVLGFSCNWGRLSTYPLPGDITVQLMKDNKFDKAKLFDSDAEALKALANSGIQVMVGITNDYLVNFVNNTKATDDWVAQNVSAYIKSGVDIRYVAVSNEAFLKDYKDKYMNSVLPAVQSMKASLDKAGLGKKVQVTVPINADIYLTSSGLPSGGDFRPDATNQVVSILKFLNDNNCPIAINIYPYLSLYYDPHFPKEFAFFNGTANPLVDGNLTYTNAFDGNLDTLLAALEKHGLGSMSIIVGEVGWPTNGAANADITDAQRFYQGLFDRINSNQGTPRRPKSMPDVYIFGLLDENAKSTLPGNFEPHWGIFNYDGSVKYQLDMGNGAKLVPAKDVKYMKKQWCVLSPKANIYDPKMKDNWNIACGVSTGCTSVGNDSACSWLDDRTKASYAFNAFYQVTKQSKDGCNFNGLAVITDKDPSPPNGTCKFDIALDLDTSSQGSPGSGSRKEAAGNAPDNKSVGVAIKQSKLMIIAVMILGSMFIIL